MLLRMYTRWAESKDYRIKTLDSLEDRFHLLQADLVIADAVDNIFNLNREVAPYRRRRRR